jgi:hypothetical protein
LAGFPLGDFFLVLSPLTLACLVTEFGLFGDGSDLVRVFAGGRRVSCGCIPGVGFAHPFGVLEWGRGGAEICFGPSGFILVGGTKRF